MKILSFFLGLLLFLSCSKSENTSTCGLVGTWKQVIRFSNSPDELFGVKMELLKDGSMKMAGITGMSWRTKDDCATFEYWATGDKRVTVEMEIIELNGNYLSLELLGGAFSGDPLGVLGSLDFKRIK